MEKKKWYQSQTIWSDIVTLLTAIPGVLSMFGFVDSDLAVKISTAICILAGSVGIHGRVNSNTKIG